MYSREVRTLVELELERNAKVREMVGAYEELAEVEKALFRLAVEISEDNTDRSVERRRHTSNKRSSEIGQERVQPYVQSLMKMLLEDYPTLLDDADIRNLMNRDYCQKILGFQLGGFPLLRRMEVGRKGSDNDSQDRYYAKLYGGEFYVCSQWWRDDHPANAQSLLRFVTQLAERNPNHPGVRALERHKQALQDYIG